MLYSNKSFFFCFFISFLFQKIFFQRSSSLLYPGITDISSRHAFEHKCSESLALAERPHLLKPGVEKEEMFGLPVRPRSFAEHEVS